MGISVSAYAERQTTEEGINLLAERLPTGTLLWVDGAGAEELKGLPKMVRHLFDFGDVTEAVRTLPD